MDRAAFSGGRATSRIAERDVVASAALDAHIRTVIAARGRARRALTAARRDGPGQLRRRGRALARLARRLAVARRDRDRLLRARDPWPQTSVATAVPPRHVA